MAASDPLDDYQLSYHEFYSELPASTDYLNDIDPGISDLHYTDVEPKTGLSEEQVSQIARDSLNAPRPHNQAKSTPDPQLFPPDSSSSK